MALFRVLVLMLVFGPLPLLGQEPIPVARGEKIRLSYLLPDSDGWTTAEGRLVSAPDSAPLRILITRQDTLVVPAADIRGLAVLRGTESETRAGFVLGGLVGAALGSFAGSLFIDGIGCGSHSTDFGGSLGGHPFINVDSEGDCNGWITGGLLGILLGGAAGASIGSNFQREKWEEIPLELRGFSVSREGRAHVAVSIPLKR